MSQIEEIKEELIELSNEIDSAKSESSELKGKIESQMDRLKGEFNLKSLEEVDEEILSSKRKLRRDEKLLVEKFSSLKKKYTW